MPGGVCANLDYEPEPMGEYVSEMSTRLVMPNETVTPAFRKFVLGILNSTRLPRTTILLGLNYLAKRVNMLNQAGALKASEGQLWKMLTVSLLLGSKFLDDNTFQNRSWSDVSGIPVAELNTMENEWLISIEWGLYVNLDRSHDYNAWIKSWKDWQDTKRHQIQQQQQQQHQSQAAMRERLAPIVTAMRPVSVQKHHPLTLEGWTPEEIAEHERLNLNSRLVRSGKTAYGPRDASWQGQYQSGWPQAQAPLTPPDSGYGTPEYLNSAASMNSRYNEWSNHAVVNGNYNRGYQPSAGPNSYSSSRHSSHFHQPYFNHGHFGQNAWDSSAADCNCSQCVTAMHTKTAPYFQAHVYGQTVMG
ncbi:Uu.00g007200.m01.CDS01 [Anthostomella pinea]|uniref:Uu.00g007200.m01.CDS01 n=1 Tax=Anthostomella pinea TaxID=933095 RepID=A0AAI8VWZ0_9PEZI|nr:Uu.00g007200.m01.CDS01 [Anthostomella pinea]